MPDLQDLEIRRKIVQDGLLHSDRCIAGQERLELSIPDQKNDGLRIGVRRWLGSTPRQYRKRKPHKVLALRGFFVQHPLTFRHWAGVSLYT